ncbi:hypothetical protein [Bacillus sp. T33-2]|uniref:hypothetical protein n=1 Tax=Bacillus sp. T33-2 TaxID=2054168 RepID=UPI0015E0E303|nr:hypothetical protein [Bacillus sp. T33-2]
MRVEPEIASEVERGEVPREDVAKVIFGCLEDDSSIGKEFQVVSRFTDVKDAISNL